MTITRGTYRRPLSSRRKNLLAALAFRRAGRGCRGRCRQVHRLRRVAVRVAPTVRAVRWAYSRQPTEPAGPADHRHERDGVLERRRPGRGADYWRAAEHPRGRAPTARRRRILPTAEWGHLATDGLVVPWDAAAAARLADLAWLRTTVAATWPQLSRSAPPSRTADRPADRRIGRASWRPGRRCSLGAPFLHCGRPSESSPTPHRNDAGILTMRRLH